MKPWRSVLPVKYRSACADICVSALVEAKASAIAVALRFLHLLRSSRLYRKVSQVKAHERTCGQRIKKVLNPITIKSPLRASINFLVVLILGLSIAPMSSAGASDRWSSTTQKSIGRIPVARLSHSRLQTSESARATTLAKAPVALRSAIVSTLRDSEMSGLQIDAHYSLSGADIQSPRFKFHVGRSTLSRGVLLSSIGSSLSVHSRVATYGSSGVLESFHSNGAGRCCRSS